MWVYGISSRNIDIATVDITFLKMLRRTTTQTGYYKIHMSGCLYVAASMQRLLLCSCMYGCMLATKGKHIRTC